MDLRELRISLGLTQLECANYLKMSLRNYQNYENNITKNIAKKNALFKKLEQYNNKVLQEKEYYTNIIWYQSSVFSSNFFFSLSNSTRTLQSSMETGSGMCA